VVAPVRKPWQIIVGFALLGLTIAAALYVYAVFYDYTKPLNSIDLVLGIASFILCPPTLLFVTCIDCEVIGWGGVIMYSIIGVLNAALYAAVGSVVVGPRKKSN
jgi:hypothetical protein